jgi:hypothetical protein
VRDLKNCLYNYSYAQQTTSCVWRPIIRALGWRPWALDREDAAIHPHTQATPEKVVRPLQGWPTRKAGGGRPAAIFDLLLFWTPHARRPCQSLSARESQKRKISWFWILTFFRHHSSHDLRLEKDGHSKDDYIYTHCKLTAQRMSTCTCVVSLLQNNPTHLLSISTYPDPESKVTKWFTLSPNQQKANRNTRILEKTNLLKNLSGLENYNL